MALEKSPRVFFIVVMTSALCEVQDSKEEKGQGEGEENVDDLS